MRSMHHTGGHGRISQHFRKWGRGTWQRLLRPGDPHAAAKEPDEDEISLAEEPDEDEISIAAAVEPDEDEISLATAAESGEEDISIVPDVVDLPNYDPYDVLVGDPAAGDDDVDDPLDHPAAELLGGVGIGYSGFTFARTADERGALFPAWTVVDLQRRPKRMVLTCNCIAGYFQLFSERRSESEFYS